MTKLYKTPKEVFYALEDSSLAPNTISSGLIRDKRWLVFSDREKNIAYAEPGSDIKLKMHGLIDAFYVVGKRGDYLHLMKYNPKVVLRKYLRRVSNWKEMEDAGWVHRSQLLLSRSAYINQKTKHNAKFITAITANYPEVFGNPKRYFDGKELKIYGAPDFTSTVTNKLPTSAIVYAYKTSDDKKFVLVGKSSQISADSGKAELIGWVPSCLLYHWGERSFWQPFYKNTISKKGSQIEKAKSGENIDFIATPSDSAKTVAQIGLEDNLLNVAPRFFQMLYPSYSVKEDTTTGNFMLRTGMLTNVFDRNKNKVYNVGGSTIPYAKLLQLKAKTSNLNLVFVVDAVTDSRDASALQPLLSVLQNIQIHLDSFSYFRKIRYGAVFLKDIGNTCMGENKFPLTNNYVSLVNFFQDKLKKSLNCPQFYKQAVFDGLTDAAHLLRNTENETNIIVVIGATSSNDSDRDNWRYVVSQLTNVKPRLIVLQTKSGQSQDYNNFVIDAKNIVLQLANNVSTAKKGLLTNPKDVKPENQFKIETSDFQSFYLDYPKNSMWQSIVLFPNKLQSLSPISVNQYLDTLLSQLQVDNNRIISSLETIFNSYVGNIYTHVDKRLKHYFGPYTETLPEVFIRNMHADLDIFALPAKMPYALPDSTVYGKKGVLVATDELESLLFYFGRLNIPWQKQSTMSRRQSYLHLRKEITGYQKQKKIVFGKKPKRLTLSQITQLFIDYHTDTPQLEEYTLRYLKKKKKMPDKDYYTVIKVWADYYTKLKSYYNDPEIIKQRSLNKDYYWIPYNF